MKKELYTPGWDAITNEFQRIYPREKNPRHYASLINWKLGGTDPLKGISVYESRDAYHFVTYGMSELYEKVTDDETYSGFGMEFTLRLKKKRYADLEGELRCIAGILQDIARISFKEGELFGPYEYIYTGQEIGFDVDGKSMLTGFITVPDTLAHTLNTPNGKVEFIELVGVTDAELKMVLKNKIRVKSLYKKIGTDITDYARKSCY